MRASTLSALSAIPARPSKTENLSRRDDIEGKDSIGAGSTDARVPVPVADPEPAVLAGETFGGSWPFEPRYSEAAGFRMHYISEGQGPETMLLLHGEPTWGYLYRHQIPEWSRVARVIAMDHMGFGKSAAPQGRSYWLQDHIDNLGSLRDRSRSLEPHVGDARLWWTGGNGDSPHVIPSVSSGWSR